MEIFALIRRLYYIMKTQLLCTFTDTDSFDGDIRKVSNFYDVLFDKVYVLQNKDDLDELLLTYNIDPDQTRSSGFYPNTISVHRKKDTNTIYTINSLNALIRSLNGGVVDHHYTVNWNDYRNCILVTDGDSYKKISTKLFRIENV
jgi:hypothetical protein